MRQVAAGSGHSLAGVARDVRRLISEPSDSQARSGVSIADGAAAEQALTRQH
jgi:hypothetical protein